MPKLKRCNYKPKDIISFNYALTARDKAVGVHFFIDDYQFERVWNRPYFYIEKLKEFECCFTPDFSLYMDMPRAMKAWNVYRSRLIGQMLQDAGAKVIPTVSWAEPETFSFAFGGLPTGGTVAVSAVGVARDADALKVWTAGMDALIEVKNPKTVLLYGADVEYDFKGVAVRRYENKAFKGDV